MTSDIRRERKTPTASFVVVANRLPVDRVELPDGGTTWRTSPGGLVTALEPVLRTQQGAWIGWHGAPDEDIDPFSCDGFEIVPVALSQTEIRDYYEGFANATLWPLYHDSVAFPVFHRGWFDRYQSVNQRFAEKTADVAEQGAVVWVQDYQLQLVPQILRELRPDLKIGFFLHIPFPPSELFLQLPRRKEIIDGLLGADLIGFQTPGAARNFLRLARQLSQSDTHGDTVNLPGRTSRARAYPISIDSRSLQEMAEEPEVIARAKEIRRDLGDPEVVFLGVDRLDYTKGLHQRIRAIGELYAEGKLDPDRVGYIQVATPSRERVQSYRDLRDDIDQLVGRINGDLGRIGRPLITYLHTSFPRNQMAALYLAADVMVVTPLRDGMNLVAKEYVATRGNVDGALVLSEFAGAARELKQAYLVNPHDIILLKETLLAAMNDTPRNKARRMRAMRRQVFEHDIEHWASSFLTDLTGHKRTHTTKKA